MRQSQRPREQPKGGQQLPDSLRVCLQDEDKIVGFTMDADTGRLTRRAEVPAAGGPSVLAISLDQRMLYAGHRNAPAIASLRIDQCGGGLMLLGMIPPPHAPTLLAPDRTGKYLLSAYYQGGFAGVHRIAADGSVEREPVAWRATPTGADAIQTDPSNRFAFVPHMARLNNNVLEPQRDNYGPNMIARFRFDPDTGQLTANSPFRVEPADRTGPRNYCFHPSQNLVFFPNEQGCGITSFRLDPATGTLSAEQTVRTCPMVIAGGTPAPRSTSCHRDGDCMPPTVVTIASPGSPSVPRADGWRRSDMWRPKRCLLLSRWVRREISCSPRARRRAVWPRITSTMRPVRWSRWRHMKRVDVRRRC